MADAPLTGGSLCSGSGGLDLGLSLSLDIEWLWHCEKDDAASKILEAHWPDIPNHGDLFETDWSVVERVDLVAAGFPCPDYSLAGKRAGIDGEHGQVWLAVAAALRALRPRYVVLENVDAIRSAPGPLDGAPGESAVGTVLADLADLGYRWAYDRIRAADVGAPHGRLRWFCVAALAPSPDAVGSGVDADRRLRRRAPGTPGSGRPAPSALATGPEVDGAEDALADGARLAADAVGERLDGSGVGDEDAAAGEGDGWAVSPGSAAPARLLPTPTAGDGKSSGSRNLEGSKAHAGVSLTDAVQMGGSTTPRLLPTPCATLGDEGRGHRGQDPEKRKEGGHSVTLEDVSTIWRDDARIAAGLPPTKTRLLPTPTATEDGVKSEKAQRPRGEGGMGSPPGLGETVRLLPTPQAADGDGGRQEKGAMGNSGVRPSGHKATLPLPTAVAMRDELTETPFAQPVEEGQLALLPTPTGYVGDRVEGQLPTEVAMLPTPVANPENPGAGGELRAALVHGESRRNETGIDTLGRPNQGRTRMLPTPTAEDGERGRAGAGSDRLGAATFNDSLLPTPTSRDGKGGNPNDREGGLDLPTAAADVTLLPTPRVTSERNSRKAMVENQQWSSVSLAQAAEIARGELPREFESWDEVPGELGRDARRRLLPLLPTPTSQLEHDSQTHRSGDRSDELLLGGIAKAHAEIQWGVYEAAVRRWEAVLDRDAPAPTDEKGRLDPPFVEWMLGYPEAWFDVEGVSRTRKLRALGNSVQVQCGEAVGGWLAFLVESGLLG